MGLASLRGVLFASILTMISSACAQDNTAAQTPAGTDAVAPNKTCGEVATAAASVVPSDEDVVGVAILTSAGMRFCHSDQPVMIDSRQIPAGGCVGDDSNCTIPQSALGSPQSISVQWGVVKEVPKAFCDEQNPPADGGACTWRSTSAAMKDPAPLIVRAEGSEAATSTLSRQAAVTSRCPPGYTLRLVWVGGSWVGICIPN